jgi:hypothetical protein
MEKTNTLPYETIHITFRCAMHLHGHWDKVVPHMNPLYLHILAMALSSIVAPIGRLMTLEAIISRIELINTTLTTKI